jgi:hypothetical protein
MYVKIQLGHPFLGHGLTLFKRPSFGIILIRENFVIIALEMFFFPVLCPIVAFLGENILAEHVL